MFWLAWPRAMTVYICMVIDDHQQEFRAVFNSAIKARRFCEQWIKEGGETAWVIKRKVK